MNFLGYHSTANHRPPLQHKGFKSGFCQISSGCQSVVSAADDDCIIVFIHMFHHSNGERSELSEFFPELVNRILGCFTEISEPKGRGLPELLFQFSQALLEPADVYLFTLLPSSADTRTHLAHMNRLSFTDSDHIPLGFANIDHFFNYSIDTILRI